MKKNKNDISVVEKIKTARGNAKKNSKINKYNIFYVDLQFLFTILIIIFGVIYIFKPSFSKWFELLLGLDLLLMAYNNQMIYKRKNFTIIYAVIGVVCLIISILNFFGIVL